MGKGLVLREIREGTLESEVRLEYYNRGDGVAGLRYEGVNKSGTPTSQDDWIIRRLEWSAPPVGTEYVVTRIQVLKGSWDGRAGLGWA